MNIASKILPSKKEKERKKQPKKRKMNEQINEQKIEEKKCEANVRESVYYVFSRARPTDNAQPQIYFYYITSEKEVNEKKRERK